MTDKIPTDDEVQAIKNAYFVDSSIHGLNVAKLIAVIEDREKRIIELERRIDCLEGDLSPWERDILQR